MVNRSTTVERPTFFHTNGASVCLFLRSRGRPSCRQRLDRLTKLETVPIVASMAADKESMERILFVAAQRIYKMLKTTALYLDARCE